MGKISDERLEKVLSYVNDRGFDEALNFFDLSPSTLKRYKRRAKERDLDINEEYESPDVLVFDVETSGILAQIWDIGKQYIDHEQIREEKCIISWAGKWLCEDEIFGDRLTSKEAKERDDERVVNSLWSALDSSDIVIAHNGDRFDKKIANTRFIVNDLDPPSQYNTIDTLKQARKNFRFPSNSLDFLTQKLCNSLKEDHSRDLWRRCMEGQEEALDSMFCYNKQDVKILSDLHFKLRPYYTSNPNMGLYYSKDNLGDRCPTCGSKNIEKQDSHYVTATAKYRTVRCHDCGAIGRERHADLTTEQREGVLRSTAK